MNFLTEKPPESLKVNGKEYPIHTDFRTVLRYMEVVEDADETLADIERCLQILYKIPPHRSDITEAAKQATWFVKCGKKEKKGKPSKKILGINSNEALNFKEDAWLIYSAFRRNDVYGIDLHTIPYLHWWEFIAMLDDIPETVSLHRIMQYRIIDTTNKSLSKEQVAFYKAMQRYYKIQQVEENEELIKALKEGRDPSPYL